MKLQQRIFFLFFLIASLPAAIFVIIFVLLLVFPEPPQNDEKKEDVKLPRKLHWNPGMRDPSLLIWRTSRVAQINIEIDADRHNAKYYGNSDIGIDCLYLFMNHFYHQKNILYCLNKYK